MFFVSDSKCVQYKIALKLESLVADDICAAIVFASSVEPGIPTDPLQFAIMQLNKIMRRNIWNPKDCKLPSECREWEDVISLLEERNRKVVDIQRDSLIFTIFCPSVESATELKDDTLEATIKYRVNKFMAILGGKWREIRTFLGEDKEILPVQGDRRMLQITNQIPKSQNPPQDETWFLTLENKINDLLKYLGKTLFILTFITSQEILIG